MPGGGGGPGMQRVMNGLLAALVLAGLGAYVGVQRTDAFVIWCWDDPIVQVRSAGGHPSTIGIRVGIEGDPNIVRGMTAYVIVQVPGGAVGNIVASPPGAFTVHTEVKPGAPDGT